MTKKWKKNSIKFCKKYSQISHQRPPILPQKNGLLRQVVSELGLNIRKIVLTHQNSDLR